MELALLFLAKALGSGIVGHYLKKLLQKLDAHLVELLESGESVDKIEAYVKEAGLEERVTAIAAKALDESLMVSLGSKDLPTVDDKCQLFADIIRLCYALSSHLQVDLLLPGSFVGPSTFSLFQSRNSKASKVSVKELIIYPPKHSNPFHVFPVPKPFLGKDDTWSRYKETIRVERQSTKAYLAIGLNFQFLIPLIEGYEVDKLTPGLLYYTLLTIMPRSKQRAIGAKNGRVSLDRWAEGISLMISALHEIRDFQILEPGELESIVRFQNRLRDLSTFA